MDLREHLQVSSRKVIDKVVNMIESDSSLFDELMLLALANESKVSWRASWAAVLFTEKNSTPIITYVPEIIKRLPDFQSDSQRGCFLKIFTLIDLDIENIGSLIDICFELISSSHNPAYIRYYAMTILENISQKEPLLKKELSIVLEENMNTMNTKSLSRASQEFLDGLRKEIETD